MGALLAALNQVHDGTRDTLDQSEAHRTYGLILEIFIFNAFNATYLNAGPAESTLSTCPEESDKTFLTLSYQIRTRVTIQKMTYNL
jgi:hypothetical protein